MMDGDTAATSHLSLLLLINLFNFKPRREREGERELFFLHNKSNQIKLNMCCRPKWGLGLGYRYLLVGMGIGHGYWAWAWAWAAVSEMVDWMDRWPAY